MKFSSKDYIFKAKYFKSLCTVYTVQRDKIPFPFKIQSFESHSSQTLNLKLNLKK
jgi:hypothetical protein